MAETDTSAPDCVRRHSLPLVVLLAPLSGIYIVIKWILSPVLYLIRLMGVRPSWSSSIDAYVNRLITPLTERSDNALRVDITPTIGLNGLLPEVNLQLPDGSSRSLRSYAGKPLLLILARGGWCSLSRLHLAELNASLPEFEEKGVQLLAVISHPRYSWWQIDGISIPIVADEEGGLFRILGLHADSWKERVWGRVLPYESVLLFNDEGRFLAADIRKVKGAKFGQTFLSSRSWLEIIDSQPL
ncbi:redoxin domain-containing protein [Gemmatimonadota bacterium]